MRQLLALALLLSITTISIAQTKTITLNYATDKSNLSPEHHDKLEHFLEGIDFAKIGLINIYGHTDTVASKVYNKKLSLKRASKVEKYFLSKGLKPSIITKNWFGENETKYPNDLIEDRRVVIELFYPIEQISTIAPAPKAKTIPDIADLFARTKGTVQEFCIPHNKDTLIRAEKGTIIEIKAGSFNLSNEQRKRKSCIQFQLKEVFLKPEMILENLSTTSDGKILETQGMIYTNALMDGDTLKLIQDIVILLPTDTILSNLKVLDGERDPHTNVMNWLVNNNSALRDFKVFDMVDCIQQAKEWEELVERCDYCENCATEVWVDLIRLRNYCRDFGDQLLYVECPRCKFLFCRVKRLPVAVEGIFNKTKRSSNKAFRVCQRSLRKSKRYTKRLKRGRTSFTRRDLIRKKALEGKVEMTEREKEIAEITRLIEKADSIIKNKNLLTDPEWLKCADLNALLETYGLDNREELILALNKPLMDEFGVFTMAELLDTLPKSNLEEIEIAYKRKDISFEDFKYYIFNASSLGWKNLDVFAKIPKEDLTKVTIPISPSRQIDLKLVFIAREFVIPAELAANEYYFNNMPKGEKAWIVGLKYEKGTPLLAMQQIIVGENDIEVDFKELTLEELKEKLKILDF